MGHGDPPADDSSFSLVEILVKTICLKRFVERRSVPVSRKSGGGGMMVKEERGGGMRRRS
jgi:hypothetical protein